MSSDRRSVPDLKTICADQLYHMNVQQLLSLLSAPPRSSDSDLLSPLLTLCAVQILLIYLCECDNLFT